MFQNAVFNWMIFIVLFFFIQHFHTKYPSAKRNVWLKRSKNAAADSLLCCGYISFLTSFYRCLMKTLTKIIKCWQKSGALFIRYLFSGCLSQFFWCTYLFMKCFSRRRHIWFKWMHFVLFSCRGIHTRTHAHHVYCLWLVTIFTIRRF